MNRRVRRVLGSVAGRASLIVAVLAAGMVVAFGGASEGRPPVLVGAGDIASCTSKGDEITAKLLDDIPGTVFTLGDNAYMDGSAKQFRRCYDPNWGRHRDRTRPVLGNHDLRRSDGKAYYDYFGADVGRHGEGWYAYHVAGWQVLVLNSQCDQVACGPDSPQARWLEEVLDREPARCTVAMWHHPLFTSGGKHTAEPRMRPLYQILYDRGAELVLTAHNHNYERFAPQDPAGVRDDGRGIRQFVVGTGGASLYRFGDEVAVNSESRDDRTYGVLKLTLEPDSYRWQFIGQPGAAFTDSGSGTCH
ncbi:metallophosphoesterase family protein [Catellatospora bangladeshensis]|uniref:metallophosphoesterase family protein n=1 Tax=Catellatospora bangladeshensis TaxID=310355 RepID=UPI0019430BDD|nr:metallophosphoesterase [Catellatospora bangladeshensis]